MNASMPGMIELIVDWVPPPPPASCFVADVCATTSLKLAQFSPHTVAVEATGTDAFCRIVPSVVDLCCCEAVGDFVLSLVAPDELLLSPLPLGESGELGAAVAGTTAGSLEGVIERRIFVTDDDVKEVDLLPSTGDAEDDPCVAVEIDAATTAGLVDAPSFDVKSLQLRLNRLAAVLAPPPPPSPAVAALPFCSPFACVPFLRSGFLRVITLDERDLSQVKRRLQRASLAHVAQKMRPQQTVRLEDGARQRAEQGRRQHDDQYRAQPVLEPGPRQRPIAHVQPLHRYRAEQRKVHREVVNVRVEVQDARDARQRKVGRERDLDLAARVRRQLERRTVQHLEAEALARCVLDPDAGYQDRHLAVVARGERAPRLHHELFLLRFACSRRRAAGGGHRFLFLLHRLLLLPVRVHLVLLEGAAVAAAASATTAALGPQLPVPLVVARSHMLLGNLELQGGGRAGPPVAKLEQRHDRARLYPGGIDARVEIEPPARLGQHLKVDAGEPLAHLGVPLQLLQQLVAVQPPVLLVAVERGHPLDAERFREQIEAAVTVGRRCAVRFRVECHPSDAGDRVGMERDRLVRCERALLVRRQELVAQPGHVRADAFDLDLGREAGGGEQRQRAQLPLWSRREKTREK
uniref:Uncharacterized protein n=1 Tax=Anopheles coluzzii TaxID=1518534 RepID=A0A8W7PEG6_ANOCL